MVPWIKRTTPVFGYTISSFEWKVKDYNWQIECMETKAIFENDILITTGEKG